MKNPLLLLFIFISHISISQTNNVRIFENWKDGEERNYSIHHELIPSGEGVIDPASVSFNFTVTRINQLDNTVEYKIVADRSSIDMYNMSQDGDMEMMKLMFALDMHVKVTRGKEKFDIINKDEILQQILDNLPDHMQNQRDHITQGIAGYPLYFQQAFALNYGHMLKVSLDEIYHGFKSSRDTVTHVDGGEPTFHVSQINNAIETDGNYLYNKNIQSNSNPYTLTEGDIQYEMGKVNHKVSEIFTINRTGDILKAVVTVTTENDGLKITMAGNTVNETGKVIEKTISTFTYLEN